MARQIQINVYPLAPLSNLGMDRRAQIAARKLEVAQLRNHCLSQYFELEVNDQDIVRTDFGKPYFQEHPDFSFNHTHSQNFYAMAMSHRMLQIGVDIEELSRKVRFQALAEHAFHPEELKIWQSLDCDPEYWFKVWTTKEAVLKANGLGIRINLNELNTQVHPEQDGGMCSLDQLGIYAYQNYRVGNCMLSVAWQAEQSCRGFAFPQIQIYQHPR
ncbi:4'-phosphopantetheinyl transferase family protein [Acinetobacter sp. LoGeW2-3]|uniref:4'-phosphopantetheinyl transferase family protein n=1 Tax=Acinetobacter sp. LoGeW2-3 TaxID=1808001 RepID=UPI001D192A95|nr:4'-phosphopantetheinyl transferase superfamily protein [Acinetobacter sp. LoGeW2-3]